MAEAEKKAVMPTGTSAVLDRRTVTHDNANLVTLVKKGQHVLDVGCGSGAITRGIADLVGDSGKVKGIDSSAHLIDAAQRKFSSISNLSFDLADIITYSPPEKYDVVSSARVLQWLSNPVDVLQKMKTLLKPGGCVSILDYNHEKVSFEPAIPASMKSLYAAFLRWRSDSGMNNTIADHLVDMFNHNGFINVQVEDYSELSTRGTASFYDEVAIWKKVAELRGPQLVRDNYLTEEDRLQAIDEYETWIKYEAKSMKLYLKGITGYIPA